MAERDNTTTAEKGHTYALQMKNIYKYFGKVVALRGIDFEVGTNEVVGLIGDNGAGKSTMVKIITGVFPPTSGDMYIRDKKVDSRSYNVQTAHKYGIETVYQEKSLGDKQPLWRNFFVGRQITNRFGFIDVKKEKEIARHILLDLIGFRGVGINSESTVRLLSGGERQGVSIGRAMYFDADLIVLDEPTVALSLKEVQKVLNFTRKIKESNRSCIYISHTLSHVYEVADRFVIIDRGEIVANFHKNEVSLHDLDEFMLKYATGEGVKK
jgi:simple sugar transport system ATP-binding protein